MENLHLGHQVEEINIVKHNFNPGQIDRQTDRQTDRLTDKQTDRQIFNRCLDIFVMRRLRDRYDKQIDRLPVSWIDSLIDKQFQIDRLVGR